MSSHRGKKYNPKKISHGSRKPSNDDDIDSGTPSQSLLIQLESPREAAVSEIPENLEENVESKL